MPKYRKKPVVIEAIQLTEENKDEISKMEGVTVLNHGPYSDQPTGQLSHARIPTLEGDMYATPGDWIITGVQGEVYPCKPEIFEQTYEPIDVDIFKAVNDEGFEQPEYVH